MAKALPFDPSRDRHDVIEITVRVPVIRRACARCGIEFVIAMKRGFVKGRNVNAMYCSESCKVSAFRSREAEELARLQRVTGERST